MIQCYQVLETGPGLSVAAFVPGTQTVIPVAWVHGTVEWRGRGEEKDMDEEQGKPDLSQLYLYPLGKRKSSDILGLSSLSKTSED